MFYYVRVTLTDESAKAFGRRSFYLRSERPFSTDRISGFRCDDEGSLIETERIETIDGERTEITTRNLVVLGKQDAKKVESLIVSKHYGTLVKQGSKDDK